MDKYGVEESAEKLAEAKEQGKCPDCGSKLEENTGVLKCPKCGTKPFEN